MNPRQTIGKIIRFIFTTNSAYWYELDLTKKIDNYKADIPIILNYTSIEETIEWLKKQNKSWVIHPNEIVISNNYKHCWPSAKHNDKIIGSIKIGFTKVYITDYERILDFSDKIAFIYDTYVLDEYRSKGVAKQLIAESAKYIKKKGYLKVGCHIPRWNQPSIKAYEKIGFQKVKYIRYFRILGLRFRITKAPKKSLILKGVKIQMIGVPYEQS